MGIINEFRRNRQGHISATPPSEGGKTLEQQKILDLSYLVDYQGFMPGRPPEVVDIQRLMEFEDNRSKNLLKSSIFEAYLFVF